MTVTVFIFTILWLSFLAHCIHKAVQFMNYTKNQHATILNDRVYMGCLLLAALVLILLSVLSLTHTFMQIYRHVADSLIGIPFAVYMFPLISILYRYFFVQGVYACNDEILMSLENQSIPLADLKIDQASTSRLHRIKAIMRTREKAKFSKEKFVLRTSTHNFEAFQSLIRSASGGGAR